MARKAGEAMVYRRLSVPKINEIDPSDNPQAGDIWIDFSVDPPVVNLLNKVLAPIVIGGGAALTPPVSITGDGTSVTLTVAQPRGGGGLSSALVVRDTTDAINVMDVSTSTAPATGANVLIQNVATNPAFIVQSRSSNVVNLVQFKNLSGVANFLYDALEGSIDIGAAAIMSGVANSSQLNVIPFTGQTIDAFTVWDVAGTIKTFTVSLGGTLSINTTGASQPIAITPTTTTGLVMQVAAPAGFVGNFFSFTVNAVNRWTLDQHGNLSFGDGTVAPTVGAGQIGLGTTTATSASAGANGAVPAQVVGYWIVNIGGTSRKIPFFAT